MDKTMKIPEKLLKTMICCLGDNGDHIVKRAKLISCGGNACDKCIENLKFRPILCNYCNDYHSIKDYSKSLLNPNIQLLIDSFQYELIDFFKNKLNSIISSIKDEKLDKIINENFNLIQIEIEIQIESAKKILENIRNDFMSELNKIRSCWKNMFPLKEAELVKRVIENSENIYEIQDKCLELDQIVKECTTELKSIKFVPNNIENIDYSFIGHLHYPSLINFNKARVISQKKYESADFLGLVLVKKRFYLIDYISKNVHIFSKDGTYLSEENADDMLIKPSCISTDKNGKIFIGDYGLHQILVFDSDLKFEKRLGPVEFPLGITTENSNNLVYVTDCQNSFIYVLNQESNEDEYVLLKKRIDSPSYIKESEDRLFVISFTEYETKNDRILSRITQGSNCIFVLHKANLKVEKTIKFDRWLCPKGLHLDYDKNILTIAHLVDLNSNISNHPFIFLINQNGNCLKAIELYSIKQVDNFIYFDKRLFTCYSNEINLVQIE